MQSVQSIGIDLPLKMLVWQDADGLTWSRTTIPPGSRIGMASTIRARRSSQR
jgi:hypothetical protein